MKLVCLQAQLIAITMKFAVYEAIQAILPDCGQVDPRTPLRPISQAYELVRYG
jgi:hypothetical protein